MSKTLVLVGKIGPKFDGADFMIGTPRKEYQHTHAYRVNDAWWLLNISHNAYRDAIAEHNDWCDGTDCPAFMWGLYCSQHTPIKPNLVNWGHDLRLNMSGEGREMRKHANRLASFFQVTTDFIEVEN